MKLWQRVVFAALVVLTNAVLSAFLVGSLAVWLGPYSVTVLLLGTMLMGWVAVGIGRQAVRPAKRTCSITALTAAHALHVAIVMSLAATTDGGLMFRRIVFIGFPLEIVVLLVVTYWTSSWIVRIVETSLAVGAWMLFLVLRGLSLWLFAPVGPDLNDVERYRMAGVVLPVATVPLLIALIVAFRRDRHAHVGDSGVAS